MGTAQLRNMIRSMMEKVLIVGTGITGAATASLLRKNCPETCTISLWDKSRGSGGRMSTSRSPADERCTADLGAQYISCTPEEYQRHKDIYEELQSQELLKPFQGSIEGENQYSEGTEHYVTPKGIGSLLKHFLKKSNADIQFGQLLKDLSVTPEGKWCASADTGKSSTFDCVVLTMPVPQILQLKGTVSSIIDSQPQMKENLQNVTYSSRFSLGLFFDPGTKIDVPWCVKYIKDDPVIRFVAVDDKKRHSETSDVGSSVVVHTTVPFGIQNIEGDKDSVCSNMVLPRVKHILPALPPHARVKNHKWRYSQVHRGFVGAPGMIVLNEQPLMLAGGDAFSYSKFDGCIDSAQKLASYISQFSHQLSSLWR